MSNPPQRTFHIAHKGRKFGPLSLAELSLRRLTDDMLVWSEGMPQWVPVSQIPELQPYVQHAAAARTSLPPARAGRPAQQPSFPASEIGAGGVWETVSLQSPSPGGTAASALPPIAAPSGPSPPTGRVKFLAITALVLGSLGLLCCPISIVGSFFQTTQGNAFAAVDPTLLASVNLATSVGMLILSIPMVIGGVGLLKGKRWGAMLSGIASALCLVGWLASAGFLCVFVQLPILNLAMKDGGSPETTGVIIGVVISGLATFVALAWHATNLFLLSSAGVRSQLT